LETGEIEIGEAMKESVIITKLRKNFIGVIHKNHGSAYGTAGLPDLEGCLGCWSNNEFGIQSMAGRCFVCEVKVGHIGRNDRVVLNSPLTEIQGYWLGEYYKSGAMALLAVYLEDQKKIAFFSSPWNFCIDNALRDIPFMKEEFVKKSIWTGSN
jgi:hypothetical protein